MNTSPSHRRSCYGLVLALGLGFGLPGQAQERDNEGSARAQEPAPIGESENATPPAGAMVFVSPETGELVSVPAAGQMERLLALGRTLATQRAAQVSDGDGNEEPQPVVFRTPVGVGVRLDDRFLHALRVHFDPSGQARWTCIDAEHDHDMGSAASSPSVDGRGVQPEAPES